MNIIVVTKTHNVKNNIISSPNLRILWVSHTYKGKIHGKHIRDKENLYYPQNGKWRIPWIQTKKYRCYDAHKKARGKELTDEQKRRNKEISSFRVKMKHAIGWIKIFRIVKDKYRCHKLFFENLVFLIAWGLHNLKLGIFSKQKLVDYSLSQ